MIKEGSLVKIFSSPKPNKFIIIKIYTKKWSNRVCDLYKISNGKIYRNESISFLTMMVGMEEVKSK